MISPPLQEYDPGESGDEVIAAVYTKLKENFSAEFDSGFTIDFKQFSSFTYDSINNFGPVIRLQSQLKPFYLTFIEVGYITTGGRRGDNGHLEYQTWGVVLLKNSYEHILIKPETLLDKIHNLITPVDLNFEEDKNFSRKYYVVTNDELKARPLLTQSFRDMICNIEVDDFMIEVIDNKLIIGNKRVVDPESAVAFAKFLNTISKNY